MFSTMFQLGLLDENDQPQQLAVYELYTRLYYLIPVYRDCESSIEFHIVPEVQARKTHQ